MDKIEMWYNAPNNEDFEGVVAKMSLDERKEMDQKVNSILGYTPFHTLSERLIAKDFLMKGYMLQFFKFLTQEEKNEILKNENIR